MGDEYKVIKDLDEISKRSRQLAVIVKVGHPHASKRKMLGQLLRHLHGPTIEALAIATVGKSLVLDVGVLRFGLSEALQSDRDLKTYVADLDFVARVASEQAKKLRKSLPSRSEHKRTGTYGAVPDLRAEGIMKFLRSSYETLTGDKPTDANQQFDTFAKTVFDAIGLPLSDYRRTKI